MATVMKATRLVNPGRLRKKRLTLKQKLHFGTKRQRVAAKEALRHNPGSRKSYGGRPGGNRKMMRARKTSHTKADYYQNKHVKRRRAWKKRTDSSRLPNVGEIITIRPLLNSGTKTRKVKKVNSKYMARRKRRTSTARRSNVGRRRTYHRRRATAPVMHRRRRRNPGTIAKTVIRYRNRGTRRRSSVRRRNAGTSFSSGGFGMAVNIIAGAMVTKFVTGMLPAGLNAGIPGYIASAIVATLQGKAIGKLLKNPIMGNQFAVGGYVYTALKIAQDMLPSSFGLPFGLSGVIGPSSTYLPQVPQYGSMANFQLPAAIPMMNGGGAMRGLGARRMGRTGR